MDNYPPKTPPKGSLLRLKADCQHIKLYDNAYCFVAITEFHTTWQDECRRGEYLAFLSRIDPVPSVGMRYYSFEVYSLQHRRICYLPESSWNQLEVVSA